MLARGDSGAVQGVINDPPGHAPRGGIRVHMVFQVQGADDQPSFAVVQFHQRRIGQVELAFQQGTPAATVGLLDGSAADPAAVAPVPPGVGLIAFVPSEVIPHVFRVGLNQCAAPVQSRRSSASIPRVTGESIGKTRRLTFGHTRHPRACAIHSGSWAQIRTRPPAAHVGLQPGRHCRVFLQGIASDNHQGRRRAVPGTGRIAQVRQHFPGHAVGINHGDFASARPVLAKDAKRERVLVRGLADGGGQRDLAVGLAAGLPRGGDDLDGNEADLRHRQAALLRALAHFLPAYRGGPGRRESAGAGGYR